jgi:hypothetical protein
MPTRFVNVFSDNHRNLPRQSLCCQAAEASALLLLNVLLQAADAIHDEPEAAQDLSFLFGVGSPLGGARPKSAISLDEERLAIAKFPKPDDTRDIAAGEILAFALAGQAGVHVADSFLKGDVQPPSCPWS